MCKAEERKRGGRTTQGQLQLNRCAGNDFQQEVFAPAATAPLHYRALLLIWMLFQQRQREPIQPREVLTHVRPSYPRFVLAVGHVQTPMAGILDAPVAADRPRELLYP